MLHAPVPSTTRCAFTFCSVCESPFEVRWNLTEACQNLVFTCPTCRQTVSAGSMHTHICFLRAEDGQFALCSACFQSFIAPSGNRPPACKPTDTFSAQLSAAGNRAVRKPRNSENVAGGLAEFAGVTMSSLTNEADDERCGKSGEGSAKPGLKKRGRKARCEICGTVFEGRDEKLLHMEREHGSAYSCLVCNARMKNAENLRRHALCHVGARKFCKGCGAGFSHVRGLRAHGRDCLGGGGGGRGTGVVRGGVREGVREGLKEVVVDRTGEMGKRFSCPICGKRFSVRPSVSRHIRIVHERLKPHLCATCGKCFSSKYNRSVHVMKNH